MNILYVTGNDQKFEEACHCLPEHTLSRVNLDLTEIQGTPEEIAIQKAKDAARLCQKPIIVEDVSLFLEGLGGFPGPYIKGFLQALGDQGIADLAEKLTTKKATVSCIAAFATPDSEPILAQGMLQGIIVQPRGALKHGKYSWNPIFQPDGFTKTMGELSMQEHAKMSMRKQALSILADQLLTL